MDHTIYSVSFRILEISKQCWRVIKSILYTHTHTLLFIYISILFNAVCTVRCKQTVLISQYYLSNSRKKPLNLACSDIQDRRTLTGTWHIWCIYVICISTDGPWEKTCIAACIWYIPSHEPGRKELHNTILRQKWKVDHSTRRNS